MADEVNNSFLVVEDLRAGYGPMEVLKGINLNVAKGEIVTIIGANGAGKSSTLMCISGVQPIRKGRILFNGQDVTNGQPHRIVAAGLVQVPEGRKIFPRLTILENLELGAFVRHDKKEIAKDLERGFTLFPILGERRSQLGGTLSGGEQQMLAIARALMGRPKMLLLDEPSMGVAPIFTARIFEAIKSLNNEGMTILLVEQNAHLALNIAKRGYVLETGKVTMSSDAQTLLADPKIREAYLG